MAPAEGQEGDAQAGGDESEDGREVVGLVAYVKQEAPALKESNDRIVKNRRAVALESNVRLGRERAELNIARRRELVRPGQHRDERMSQHDLVFQGTNVERRGLVERPQDKPDVDQPRVERRNLLRGV